MTTQLEVSRGQFINVEWVPDPEFRLVTEPHRCSSRKCDRPAVAVFFRKPWRASSQSIGSSVWCCDLHIYGRRIIEGVVCHWRRIGGKSA